MLVDNAAKILADSILVIALITIIKFHFSILSEIRQKLSTMMTKKEVDDRINEKLSVFVCRIDDIHTDVRDIKSVLIK